MKSVYIGIFLLVGVIFIITIRDKSFFASREITQVESVIGDEEEKYNAQTKQVGSVEVEIKPENLVPGQKILLNITLNTHSVDLGYDYTKIITAKDDKGNEYKALKWTGGESGHHLTGELVMEELSEDAGAIRVNLEGIDNQKEVFEWELGGEK